VNSELHGRAPPAWLTKPVDHDSFLSTVEDLLRTPAPLPPARANQSAHRRPRVLVIEDERVIREVIIEHLVDEGFAPEPAANMAEARSRLRIEHPWLILLDLMLPGQNGWVFLRERRHDPVLSNIPVLVISAAAKEELLEAKKLGADAFLSKPFDLGALSTLVHNLAR
jgi:DNA-binding response OmpR family regulator